MMPIPMSPVMTGRRSVGMANAMRIAVCATVGATVCVTVCVTVRITLPVTMSIPLVFLRTTTEQRHQHEQTSRHCRKHIQIQHSRDCPPATTTCQRHPASRASQTGVSVTAKTAPTYAPPSPDVGDHPG